MADKSVAVEFVGSLPSLFQIEDVRQEPYDDALLLAGRRDLRSQRVERTDRKNEHHFIHNAATDV